jgi:hypothetical protein
VREAAQQQAEKTETSVERISGMLREAQEKTQARIESLTEILNAGLAAETASAEAAAIEASQPASAPPAPAQPAGAGMSPDNPDHSVMLPRPKKTDDDDDLAQRLRRLSKPE